MKKGIRYMQKAVVLGIFIVLLIPISIANGAEDDGTILRNMNSTIQEALSESKEGDRQEQYGNIGFVGYNHDDHAQDIDMYIDDRGHVETAHNIPPGGYYSSAYLYAETEGWHEVWIEWDDGAHSNHTTYYVVAYETEEVRLDVDYLLDTDNNGFNDPYEQQLANMFCPSFVLHSGDHGVSPEPVQIAFQNQQNQVILWASTHDASGAYDGEAYVDATGYDYSWYDSEEFQENPYACNPSCDVYGNYFLYPHFDYGGAVDCHDEISSYDYDQPSGWYDLYQYGSDWAKPGSDYENTVYAHLFTEGGEYIIQYWFFYPFNDFVNNHEGDWEHINVVITSQNPATAQINRVIYYFHHYYYIAYTTQIENPTTFDCYVIDGTHPIVFVGGHGDAEGCWVSGAGEGSHGSYPIFGTWPTIQPEIDLIFCSIPPIDETVDGNGNWIGYSTIVDDNINDIDGVFIIKGREDYNFQQHPEMSWLGANIIWGYPYVKSMGTENELYDGQNVGNYAPCGPVFNDGWEVVDWNVGEANGQDGFARYYSLPDGYSHVSDAGWAPPEYPVVNQNTGEEFLTIQSAIDDVNTLNGHTIFVHSGVYNEDVLVSKSLTLQGEDKDTTIIHCSGGTGYADAVKITATNVIIRGFTLENSGSGTYAAGIDVRASYATITGNIIKDNQHHGILLIDSAHHTSVRDNIIRNNAYKGMWVLTSNNNIHHNTFIDNLVYNAYASGSNNNWDDGTWEGGNNWDDFSQNSGYPYDYYIPGGNNVDRHPVGEHNPPSCFLRGTPISMSDGSIKNIEDVKVGDRVLSYDFQTEQVVSSSVIMVFHHAAEEMKTCYLLINEDIRVTPNHPLFINGQWKMAGFAKVGDQLLDLHGTSVTITSIARVFTQVPTYNLEVASFHNYFANGILAHNKPIIQCYNLADQGDGPDY